MQLKFCMILVEILSFLHISCMMKLKELPSCQIKLSLEKVKKGKIKILNELKHL